MRIRQLATRAALSVALSAGLLGTAAATEAAADSSTQLPIAGHADIVVDGVHDRVFISDPDSGSVVVTDYDGTVIERITSQQGAFGLALSEDSTTLYVALRDADAISAVDTATLRETARYATGTDTEPQYPAVAGGRVWFGYGGPTRGDIGSLDLTGPQPAVGLGHVGRKWYTAPMLATSPGAPGMLVAGETSSNPPQLAVYDVSAGGTRETASLTASGGSVDDLAVTPDGTEVVVASGAPYHHQVYRTSDLSVSGRYTTNAYPNAVAITPDGSTVAAGINGAYDPDVYLFRAGADTVIRTYDFPSTSINTTTLRPAGLAWADDNSRLFAVTKTYESPTLTLRVLNDPARAVTTVTLDAPPTAPLGKKLTITGTLASETPFPAGTTVRVTRYDYGLPEEGLALGSYTVAADGTFAFTDRPDTVGQTSYAVRYAGDPQHTAAQGVAYVDIT
ncbi:YncE family protein [Streptomyces sp. NPDC047886]|uniref:YncE family protein n=1 Tax=Streptomyces sp. NPDC047886 TaxID=3365490 RepID=UPI00371E2193